MPSDAGCCIFFRIGVDCTGIVARDGISPTLMISGFFCSSSTNGPHDLVLTLVGLTLSLASASFGGAMAMTIECFLGSNNLCDLCSLALCILVAIALCLFSFRE
jgi:hypothetical protein